MKRMYKRSNYDPLAEILENEKFLKECNMWEYPPIILRGRKGNSYKARKFEPIFELFF